MKITPSYSPIKTSAEDSSFTFCPHCDGYGSSLRDKDDEQKCSYCGGTGRVSKDVAKRYYEHAERGRSKRADGLRPYFLKKTTIFATEPYNVGTYALIAESAGAKNVAIGNGNTDGQNYVLVFHAEPPTVAKIEMQLNALPEFRKMRAVILEKG